MFSRLTSGVTGLKGAVLALPILLAACTDPAVVAQPQSFDASTELAIACRHDEALATLTSTEAARGGSTSASELQRVILLRNAGRTMDAASVLRQRNARDDVTADEAVQSGTQVEDALDSIRAQRAARSGSRSCG